MRHLIHFLLAFSLVACSVRGRGGSKHEEQPDARIDYEPISAFVDNVLTIDATQRDGTRIRLNTLRDGESTAPYPPDIPGYSGRSWTLLKAGADSTSMGYAVVSWNDDDPTDYLSAGRWIHFDNQRYPDIDPFHPDSTFYIFIDGPETDPSHQPPLPVEGTASYTGGAGGRYLYRYGDHWGDAKDKISSAEFAATIALLEADFTARTVGGFLGCEGDIEVQRRHLASAFDAFETEPVELLAHPRDYELHLAPTVFNPDGTFETDEGVTVTHPERSIQQVHRGFWGGGLSNRRDSVGNPRMASGFASALFSEADGSTSYFTAIFNGLSDDFRAANPE